MHQDRRKSFESNNCYYWFLIYHHVKTGTNIPNSIKNYFNTSYRNHRFSKQCDLNYTDDHICMQLGTFWCSSLLNRETTTNGKTKCKAPSQHHPPTAPCVGMIDPMRHSTNHMRELPPERSSMQLLVAIWLHRQLSVCLYCFVLTNWVHAFSNTYFL